MKMRPFGKTGIQVSAVGLGAWQLASPDWKLNDTDEAQRIVHASLDAGCNFFDTAPAYGNGQSETILGQALRDVRRNVIICTKFSHHNESGAHDFETQHIRGVLEGSLRRLQTDYVDILLLHNPPREAMDGRVASQYEELERLKQEGKIREYGVSLDWRVELEMILNTTNAKASEVFYNALYQEPKPAFNQAYEQGVGLIVKVPLDSGWLSGRYRSTSRFDDVRGRWSPEVIARRSALVERFAELIPSGTSLIHAALQYSLAHPAIATTIPGAKSVEQALDNFAAADSELPPEVIKAIDQLWIEEIAHDPLPW